MTDKELKKLSRLELLELLLEASNENKRLKEKIKALKDEARAAQKIENLSVAAGQVENALKYANTLVDNLKSSKHSEAEGNIGRKKQSEGEVPTDREIYIRMLRFFVRNDDKLKVFDDDLQKDVRARIKSILERKK